MATGERVPVVEAVIAQDSRPARACRLDLLQYDERSAQEPIPGVWKERSASTLWRSSNVSSGTLATTVRQFENRW